MGSVRWRRGVFGDAVRLERVRIRRGFGRFAVTVGSNLFLPARLARADFALAEPPVQALFVHELVHVWQFQTRPGWTLRSWAAAVLSGGYGRELGAYRYTLPLGDFMRLNLEQQASVVEHAVLLRQGLRAPTLPWGACVADLAGAPFPLEA